MSDDDAPDTADDGAPKKSGDFLRLYVVVMALMAGVLGWFWWNHEGEADEYVKANERARSVFGDGPAGSAATDARPTTIRALGVGVLKYLGTSAGAGKTEEGINIPAQTIRDRAEGVGLKVREIAAETSNKNAAKRYEEISVNVVFEPADLEALAKFLYNIEATSPNLRILEFRWDLKPEKENPVVPGSQAGHLINRPNVKIGFRRPYSGSR